jgi:hypothetical protein
MPQLVWVTPTTKQAVHHSLFHEYPSFFLNPSQSSNRHLSVDSSQSRRTPLDNLDESPTCHDIQQTPFMPSYSLFAHPVTSDAAYFPAVHGVNSNLVPGVSRHPSPSPACTFHGLERVQERFAKWEFLLLPHIKLFFVRDIGNAPPTMVCGCGSIFWITDCQLVVLLVNLFSLTVCWPFFCIAPDFYDAQPTLYSIG